MPRRRERVDLGLTADINVTSLVDVAFTLLVIFIITAPILQGGVDVQVPRAASETITAPEGVVVTVDREGAIFIGDSPIAWEEFEQALTDVARERQAQSVYLRADQDAAYGSVLRVLGAMKQLDVANVGLVAEPETGR